MNMARSFWLAFLAAAAVSGAGAQPKSARIDVLHYGIAAEINPRTQSLAAKVDVKFVAVDDKVSSVVFELNNALNVLPAIMYALINARHKAIITTGSIPKPSQKNTPLALALGLTSKT